MEMQDVENAVVPIASPQGTTIVCMSQYPHFQKVTFSLVYMEMEGFENAPLWNHFSKSMVSMLFSCKWEAKTH